MTRLPPDHHDDAGAIDHLRLCDAAAAVFLAIARHQCLSASQTLALPVLLASNPRPMCPCEFTRDELIAAEAFLLRLGVIERRHPSDMPVIDL